MFKDQQGSEASLGGEQFGDEVKKDENPELVEPFRVFGSCFE